MLTLKEAVNDFLSQKRIAIAGVSATRDINGNRIYRKFRESGYSVFAINPNAKTVEGDPCYSDLKSIEGGVDGVFIITRPEETEKIVAQCVQARVPRVWIHRSFTFIGNSVSETAVRTCRENGISVIPGACPMMYLKPIDWKHICLREAIRLYRFHIQIFNLYLSVSGFLKRPWRSAPSANRTAPVAASFSRDRRPWLNSLAMACSNDRSNCSMADMRSPRRHVWGKSAI